MPITGDYAPSPSQRSANQVETYERSGGTKGTTMNGLPVVIVTTIGAKTGKVRKVPLMKVEHGGKYLAVASYGGSPRHPVWYYNLVQHPHVELQDGGVKQDMVARELTGHERAEWWARAVEAFPTYAAYQRKTDREIPLFLLTAP